MLYGSIHMTTVGVKRSTTSTALISCCFMVIYSWLTCRYATMYCVECQQCYCEQCSLCHTRT